MSRELAATLAHTTCPRCGSHRASGQIYCVECGLRLPVVLGAVSRLRRGWIRRLGWYPGDWFWVASLGLVLAIAGAAASILVNHRRAVGAAATVVAAPPKPSGGAATGVTGPNGQTSWPAGLDGWTVVLLSAPVTKGAERPRATARAAVRHGLSQVGVLDSSGFGSLHPGYFVVFSGFYGASGDAELALKEAQARGYGAAYVLRVAP